MTELEKTGVALPMLAAAINAAHHEAHAAAATAMERAYECGRLLSEARAAVAHGQWLTWIDGNLSFGARQAQKYIRLFTHFESLPDANCNAHLGIDRALEAIAEPAGPRRNTNPPANDDVLPDGPDMLRVGEYGRGFVFIFESARHAGFYFLSHLMGDPDDDGGTFETLRKPIHESAVGDALAAMLPPWVCSQLHWQDGGAIDASTRRFLSDGAE